MKGVKRLTGRGRVALAALVGFCGLNAGCAASDLGWAFWLLATVATATLAVGALVEDFHAWQAGQGTAAK